MSKKPDAFIIVNPSAGGYATEREWPHIQQLLKDHLGYSFDYKVTEHIGQATQLAEQAIKNGCRFLVAVGGDGTVNEVANGILSTPDIAVTLGVIGTGGGCCFGNSLRIPRDYHKAVLQLCHSRKRRIDVALINYVHQGKKQKRYLINHADIGFGAEATRKWNNIPPKTGRGVSFGLRFGAIVASLKDHRNIPLEVEMDGHILQTNSSQIILENGQYFANKMLAAPSAKLDDGLLDIIMLNNVSKLELLSLIPRTYNGSYIKHPKVSTYQVRNIKVKSQKQFYIEVDGEFLGEGPISISVLPSSLTVAV